MYFTPSLIGLLVAEDESVAAEGLAIAFVGLLIVFTALILISLFIASLPWILRFVGQYWPEVDDAPAHHSHPESQVPDNDAVLAAIGFVLHTEFQRQLESEEASGKKN
ncbi:MAG: OadG family protein [Rubripirellula sp.]